MMTEAKFLSAVVAILILLIAVQGPLTIALGNGHEEATHAEVTTNRWYHDCSNTSAFDGLGNTSWNHLSTLGVSFGALDSESGFIIASDYGNGSDWHGPLQYHTLATPFPIRELISLRIEVEIDGSTITRMGKVIVGLFDEPGMQIAQVAVDDGWVGLGYAFSNGLYQFTNGSFIHTPLSYPDYTSPEPHLGNVTLHQNATGMFTDIPTGNNEKLIDAADVESTRTVRYISLYIARHNDYPVTETLRLHEIEMVWGSQAPTTTTTTTSTDGTWPPGPLPNLGLLLALGLGVALIIMILVILFTGSRRGT